VGDGLSFQGALMLEVELLELSGVDVVLAIV
jgi:hypothetical protein